MHSDQQQQPTRLLSSLWWQLSSANSLWKQRLRHSIEALRHFGCQPPPEYTINEDAVGSSAPDKPKELTSMDIAEAEQEPHCVVTLRH